MAKKKARKPAKSRNCFRNRWGDRQCECRKKNGQWRTGTCT